MATLKAAVHDTLSAELRGSGDQGHYDNRNYGLETSYGKYRFQ